MFQHGEMVTKSFPWIRFALIGVLLSAMGCGYLVKKRIPRVDYYTPEMVVQRVNENQKGLKNFIGSAEVKIDSPGGTQRISARLAYIAGDSLFLDIHGPFGMTVGRAMIEGTRFSFYSPFTNQCFYGDIDDLDEAGYWGGFDPAGLAKSIGGTEDVLPQDLAHLEGFQQDEATFTLTFLNGGEKRVVVDKSWMTVKRVEYFNPAGQLTLVKLYGDFGLHGGTVFPGRIILSYPPQETTLTLNFSELDLNVRSPQKAFQMGIPADAEWVNVSGIESENLTPDSENTE